MSNPDRLARVDWPRLVAVLTAARDPDPQMLPSLLRAPDIAADLELLVDDLAALFAAGMSTSLAQQLTRLAARHALDRLL